jgi:hypothetical protein
MEMEEENYWFIPDNGANSFVRQRARNTESKKSFKVKFCNMCHRAYESFYENNSSGLNYYDGFITYGLDRKTCGSCNEPS